MPMYKIRWAAEEDCIAVLEIARQCWEPIYESYKKILGEELYTVVYPNAMDVKQEKVRAAVIEGRAFVAESQGSICGFATFYVGGQVGTLTNNGVAPNYKGNGIAGKLYERIFEELRQRKCTVVGVVTGLDDAYAPARRAYEKMGFEAGLPSIQYYKKL